MKFTSIALALFALPAVFANVEVAARDAAPEPIAEADAGLEERTFGWLGRHHPPVVGQCSNSRSIKHCKGGNWGVTSNCGCSSCPNSWARQCACEAKGWKWDHDNCQCVPKDRCPNSAWKKKVCEQKKWIWNQDKCQCICPPKPTCPNRNFRKAKCERKKWIWNDEKCECICPPKPSGSYHRRDATDIKNMCPKPETACRISSIAEGFDGQFECIDTTNDIESCGGCVNEGQGQDCTAIEGVSDVACVASKCVVTSCLRGYKAVGAQCVPDSNAASQQQVLGA